MITRTAGTAKIKPRSSKTPQVLIYFQREECKTKETQASKGGGEVLGAGAVLPPPVPKNMTWPVRLGIHGLSALETFQGTLALRGL